MVDNKAIVNIVQKLTDTKGAPCKKTLQKIVFLIEAKHIDLGCDYGIHFYGPYSSDLDFAVREMNDEGILNIEYTAMEHKVSVADDLRIEDYNNKTVDEIIKTFGKCSPSKLELIATTLYVYLQLNDTAQIKEEVIKIKGSKYSEQQIDEAIELLKKTDYIAA